MSSLTKVISANAVFFLTGIAFVPLYQQATYWGFNEPTSFLAPYAFFFFNFAGGLIQMMVMRQCRASERGESSLVGATRQYTKRQVRLCLVIAGFTVVDNVVSIISIGYIGGMLYSIVYGWVVVVTALLRRFVLKRNIGCWQWVGVVCVACGLSVAGVTGESSVSDVRSFIIGFACVVLASTCDAFMYVCVEDLMGMTAGCGDVVNEIIPAELACAVGFVGTMILAPVGWVYAVTGYWKTALYDPMSSNIDANCTHVFGVQPGNEPSPELVVLWWILGGVVMYVHYLSFYYLIKCVSNSVVAGVAKAVQSAAIFFVNAALFGGCDTANGITSLKVASASCVIGGTLVYSMCKPAEPATPPEQAAILPTTASSSEVPPRSGSELRLVGN